MSQKEDIGDVLVQISTRIPRKLHRAVKSAVIEDETRQGIMGFVQAALVEKLARRKAKS